MALLVIAIPSPVAALWAGLGWATAEVAYTVVAGLAIRVLLVRTDPDARVALNMLAAQGMLRAMAPLAGIVERVSASLLHIGLTLVLFSQPWVVLVAAPLHSSTNVLALRATRRSLLLAEALLAIIGTATFALGASLAGLL